MALHSRNQCGPCCKQHDDCNTCGGRCLPKYLCVVAILTPSYDDTGCHCDSINGRLFSSSAFCGWYGQVFCAEDSLTFQVRIDKNEDGSCTTVVECIEFESTYSFSGSLEGIAFSGTYNGISYDVTIGRSSLVENPLAFGNCPICKCATCLPKAFCAIYYDFTTGTVYTGTLPWLCESQSYDAVTLNDQTVAITLSTTSCELFVTADAGMTTISLESQSSGNDDASGIICLESPSVLTKGKSPFTTIEQPGFLTGSIVVITDGSFTGLIEVQELPCDGECSGCIPKPNRGYCCDYIPDSLTMHVRCTSDATYPCDESQTQVVPYLAGYTGVFRFCDLAEDVTIVADCENDLITQNEWTLTLTTASSGGSGKRLANIVPCPAILLLAVFTVSKDYGPPIGVVTYTFEITVTL